MAKTKQLPAGKSKAITAAAKRKAASSKTSTTKKSTTTKKVSAPRVAAPSAVATPTAAVSAKAPVSSPTGSLISQETWQSDQARLQSASEDQDTVDTLNETEANADSTYTAKTTAAAKAAALRKLELDQQKAQFEKNKSEDYKNLDNSMAYRGATRSSAAERGYKGVVNQHTNIANEYKNAASAVDTEVNDINTQAYNEREATKGFVTKRRGSLANRAAAKGVYSVGSASEDGGVSAPIINDAEPASPGAPAASPASPASPAAKAAKKKKAASNTAAAKRRIAAKKPAPKKKGK